MRALERAAITVAAAALVGTGAAWFVPEADLAAAPAVDPRADAAAAPDVVPDAAPVAAAFAPRAMAAAPREAVAPAMPSPPVAVAAVGPTAFELGDCQEQRDPAVALALPHDAAAAPPTAAEPGAEADALDD